MAGGGRRSGSGRKAKPRELKILEGSFRKDRHGDEPPAIGGFPSAPADLSDLERELWDAMPRPAWVDEPSGIAVRELVRMRALQWQNEEARRATPEAGAPLAYKVTHDADGGTNLEPKENPLITQAVKLSAQVRAWLVELCLTPATKSKASAPKTSEAIVDKWAGIL